MSACRFGLVLAVALSFRAPPASAILIETPTGRVGGFLLNDDGTKIKISVPTPEGEDKVSEHLRAEVKIVHQLDVKRLEALSKDNPKAYRDYAEDLARQEADPEARYTALRLFLIAAYLAPDELGSGCLLRMSALANSPAGARKFRAMAFLLDPKADAEVLKLEGTKPVRPAPLQGHALEDFTKALQLYRSGQIKQAAETVKREGVDRVFATAPEKIDVKQFLQWCADASCTTCKADGGVNCPNCMGRGTVPNMFNQLERCPMCKGKKRVLCPDCGGTHVRDPLPDDTLRVVLRCELWAMDQQGGVVAAGQKDAPEVKGWSTVLQSSRRVGPVLPLSLETITSFDPRKCLYRNRKWVAE